MGFLNDGLEPRKQAQDELLLRLDAMLVELHTMTEVLYEVRGLLATGESSVALRELARPVPVAGNGTS